MIIFWVCLALLNTVAATAVAASLVANDQRKGLNLFLLVANLGSVAWSLHRIAGLS